MGSESIQRSQQTTLLQGARPSPKYRLHLLNSVGLTPILHLRQSRQTKKAFMPRVVEGSVICKRIFNCRPPQVHLRQPYQFRDDLLLWGISIDNLLQPLVPL